MANRKWLRKHPEVKPFVLLIDQEDRERWDEDARLLGFPGFGTQYLRWLLNGRHDGRLLILDPATQRFGEMIGSVLGQSAGETLARVQLMYLQGR